jgi:hypothetical protein
VVLAVLAPLQRLNKPKISFLQKLIVLFNTALEICFKITSADKLLLPITDIGFLEIGFLLIMYVSVPEVKLNVFDNRSQMKLDVVENWAISIPLKMLHQVLEGHQFWSNVF